jgi:hypothetical protein
MGIPKFVFNGAETWIVKQAHMLLGTEVQTVFAD